MAFIGERDSFCLATVSETGWPYIQHRGGPKGFLKVLDPHTLGFADYRGNRQYVSVGNLAGNDRVALILMDYAKSRRLKLLGRATTVGTTEDEMLLGRLRDTDYRARVERGVLIRIEAFDWNCPLHITPRFTIEEIELSLEPLRARIRELEEQVASHQ
jgi:predicted pyridoxine 5'-phosphate oxidase superfamily flavin-nucleotide-binding protein